MKNHGALMSKLTSGRPESKENHGGLLKSFIGTDLQTTFASNFAIGTAPQGREGRYTNGTLVHQTRATVHYEAATGMLAKFGHATASGKGSPPALTRTFLGIVEDLEQDQLYLTEGENKRYKEQCIEIRDGKTVKNDGVMCPFKELNTMVHRLLHAASIIVLGCQHLYHLKGALRVTTNLRSGACILYPPAINEIEWWITRLGEGADHGVPLASRFEFPQGWGQGVIDTHSEASRELKSYLNSGAGAWAIIAGTLYFTERRWSPHKLHTYSINVLEMAVKVMGTIILEGSASKGLCGGSRPRVYR
jgi:hypothetical protein